MKRKDNRGGARPGAGRPKGSTRPPKPKSRRVSVHVRLSPTEAEHLDDLRDLEPPSTFLRTLLLEEVRRKTRQGLTPAHLENLKIQGFILRQIEIVAEDKNLVLFNESTNTDTMCWWADPAFDDADDPPAGVSVEIKGETFTATPGKGWKRRQSNEAPTPPS